MQCWHLFPWFESLQSTCWWDRMAADTIFWYLTFTRMTWIWCRGARIMMILGLTLTFYVSSCSRNVNEPSSISESEVKAKLRVLVAIYLLLFIQDIYGFLNVIIWLPLWMRFLGLYSLSGKTSYRKISWSLEAARFGFKLFQSFWNLAGTSAALLPRCLSNFRAIRLLQHPISRLRDFTRFGGKTSYRLVNRGPGTYIWEGIELI